MSEDRTYSKWNDDELELLTSLYPYISARKISEIIPHPYESIRTMACKVLKIKKDYGHSFKFKLDKDSIETILKLYNEGYSINEISKKLSISNYYITLVLKEKSIEIKKQFWSKKQIECFKEYFPNMSTFDFREKYMKEKTIEQINSLAYRLKIYKSNEYLGERTKSNGEQMIQKYLEENNIKYIREKRFDDCKNVKTLPFDFYLTEYNICIEFQGIQHYEPVDRFGGEESFIKQLNNDEIKRRYCHENNIKLIEIPYWDYCCINSYIDNIKGGGTNE